jgi:hypothetical protein
MTVSPAPPWGRSSCLTGVVPKSWVTRSRGPPAASWAPAPAPQPAAPSATATAAVAAARAARRGRARACERGPLIAGGPARR